MTPVPTDLLEKIRDTLLRVIADEKLGHTEVQPLVDRIERVLGAEPKVARAWLLACLASFEEQPKPPTPPGPLQTDDMAGASEHRPLPSVAAEAPPAPTTDLAHWHADHRVLVGTIRAKTGVEPWTTNDDGHRLHFKLCSHDEIAERSVPYSGSNDSLTIALRNVARIVKLDHNGAVIR